MHPPSTVRAALRLREQGLNASEIARCLGLPRATVRDWLAGSIPTSGSHDLSACDRCGHEHRIDSRGETYVYLLGLYLGDGCLSAHARGVYRLRIVLDLRYPQIIASARAAVKEIRRGVVNVQPRTLQNCVEVQAYWKSWPCLFPQHGPGRKHARRIFLADWQLQLVDLWPDQLLRGLIHSDGCRFQNTGRGGWSHPRYSFSQVSYDIQAIFCHACDLMGLHWTKSGQRTIYVSRKADVARLDEFIGPKR